MTKLSVDLSLLERVYNALDEAHTKLEHLQDRAARKVIMTELKKLIPSKTVYAWECNDCGSQEYTMAVSEDDVHNLGCGGCGGCEWHKAISKS